MFKGLISFYLLMKSKNKIMEKIQLKIESKIKSLQFFVKEHLCDKNQFETNYKNIYFINQLQWSIDFLYMVEGYIGQQVFKFEKGFNVSLVENPDIFNKTHNKSFLFTEEDFEKLKISFLNHWIEHFSENLIKRSLAQYSTSPISNLEYAWKLEIEQNLIQYFKDLLNDLK